MRPILDYGVGVEDVKSGQFAAGNKQPARVALPNGSLGSPGVTAVSPDLQWLALSGADRGAVGNLRHGKRLYLLRAFKGAPFAGEGNLYVDFPRWEKTDRQLVQVSLSQRLLTPLAEVDEESMQQYGPYWLVRKAEKRGVHLDLLPATTIEGYLSLLDPIEIGAAEKVTREIRDVQTRQTLWSRYFGNEAPGVYLAPREGTWVLMGKATAKAVQAETQGPPEARQRLEGAKPGPFNDFLEGVDARRGKYLGSLLFDSGKGALLRQNASAAGEWVAATGNQNRRLLYSLASGEIKGRFFGPRPALLPQAGLRARENERGHLALYDLSSMEEVDEFVFPRALVGKPLLPMANATGHRWSDGLPARSRRRRYSRRNMLSNNAQNVYNASGINSA